MTIFGTLKVMPREEGNGLILPTIAMKCVTQTSIATPRSQHTSLRCSLLLRPHLRPFSRPFLRVSFFHRPPLQRNQLQSSANVLFITRGESKYTCDELELNSPCLYSVYSIKKALPHVCILDSPLSPLRNECRFVPMEDYAR